MNRYLHKAFIFVLLALGMHCAQAADLADNPGYLDLDRVVGIAGRQPSVEVTLSGPVLKMLLQLPVRYDTDAARAVELLKVVDHILVRVFPIDSARADDMLAFIDETSATLEAEQWTRIVRVRDEDDDSHVDIHVKLSPDGENLNGLTVMAVEDDGGDSEVVFVNIVGNFNPAYLATIGEQFDIDYLGDVDVP